MIREIKFTTSESAQNGIQYFKFEIYIRFRKLPIVLELDTTMEAQQITARLLTAASCFLDLD